MTGSGTLTYTGPDGVSGIIESIVHTEIKRPLCYDGDKEDLKQEMRMAAIKAMPRYDSARIGPSPFKFLQQCVRNHLYNLNRGVHVPNNPPCVRCDLWDSVNKVCKIQEEGCEAILKYRANMKTKAAIRNPSQLPDFDVTSTYRDNSVNAFLLDESIRSVLPDDLIPFYDKMVKGQPVESRRKTKIRKIIRIMLEEDDAS